MFFARKHKPAKQRNVDAEFYAQLLQSRIRHERLLACLLRLGKRGLLPQGFVDEVQRGGSDPEALACLLQGLPEAPLEEPAAPPAMRPRSETRRLVSLRPGTGADNPGWGLTVRDGQAQAPEQPPRRPSGRTPRRLRALPSSLSPCVLEEVS